MKLLPLPPPSGQEPLRVRLKCRWEPFSKVADEARSLFTRQQAEIGEDYEPLDPDWDFYYAYERAGSCAVWTARTMEGVLAGYVVWITSRGRHAVETIFAEADLLYLAPEWREGLTGYKFLKSAIAAIRKEGPDIIRVETNDLFEDGRVGVLLKRLGFRRVGTVWRS